MASSQTFFQNARDFEMRDTQFNTITGNANVMVVNNTGNNDAVTTILWPHVAAGAIFDSAARYAAGKCHPGTRKKIIEGIFNWINNPDPATERILWLYGAAGAGKSAIAHTICERLQQDNPDWFGGSFFFEFGLTDRGNAHKLFSTISYQLAIRIPSMRTEINNLLSRDPSLPTKSMEIQLDSLIVQPLLRCQSFLSHSPTFIIDGLDECADDEGMNVQRNIVNLIAKSIVDNDLPLRVIIASRPEYWIRDAFDIPPLPTITLPLSLRDDVDADEDIKAYLTEEFEKIRVANKRIMGSVVPPWPPTKVIKRFVEEASGQYIYAATILKFVGNCSRFSNPKTQLEIILSPGPHRALAFSELDRLYATVLSAYPRWENMKRVLAGILVKATATILKVVLHMDSDELVLVLDALSSLIDINKPEGHKSTQPLEFLQSIYGDLWKDDQITFSHRSFQEFLQDQTRSGVFCIDLDLDAVPKDIVHGVFDMICINIDEKYKREPRLFWNIGVSDYNRMIQDVTFLSVRHCRIGTLLKLITDLTKKIEPLFETSAWTHMHSLFYFVREMKVLLHGLQSIFNNTIHDLHKDKEDPDILGKFNHASHHCARVISRACRRARFALSSCADFEVTPALVYLTEYSHVSPLNISGFRNVVDNDLISALRQYSYIVPLDRITTSSLSGLTVFNFRRIFLHDENDSNETSEVSSRLPETWPSWSFHALPRANEEPDWSTQGAWRDLRILFAHKSLELIIDRKSLESEASTDQLVTLARFFISSISDISSKEYFQNPSNIAILKVMANTEAWIPHCKTVLFVPRLFIVSMLCWFNRQLTNPETKKLLQEYDKALEKGMTRTMTSIFKHTDLQNLAKSVEGGVVIWSSIASYIAVKVKSLPQGYDVEEIDFHGPCLGLDAWLLFYKEVFTPRTTSTQASTLPIIDPSNWHPHLFFQILTHLVECLYNRILPTKSIYHYSYESRLFRYIQQCLPYAQPTPNNLDAVRAIVYLYPQISRAWDPPEGFWTLFVEFLQKYDRSVLSSEELDLFVKWLNSTEHADIKTYVV